MLNMIFFLNYDKNEEENDEWYDTSSMATIFLDGSTHPICVNAFPA